MLWQLGAVIAVLVLAAIFAKRVIRSFVSALLCKIFRCNSVKFSRVGLLSVTDVKVRFPSFTVDVNKIWLSSSIFNQAYTKPLAICFDTVRLEAYKPLVRAEYFSSESSVSNGGFSGKLKQFSSLLQYASATINSLDIVLLDVVLPDCLVHLAVEQIDLDTFRDRESLQIELYWKLLSFKMLQRSDKNDSNEKAKELIQLATESRMIFYFQPTIVSLRAINVQIINPIMAVSDAILNIIPKNAFSLVGKRSMDARSSRRPDFENLTINCKSSSMTIFTNDYNGNFKVAVNNVGIQALRDEKSKRLKVELSEIHISDHRSSGISVTTINTELEHDKNDEMFTRFYLENLSGHSNFDSFEYWRKYLSQCSFGIGSSKTEVSSRTVHISVELTCLSCSFLLPTKSVVCFNLMYCGFTRDMVSQAYELSIDSLSVTTTSDGSLPPEGDEIVEHRWGDLCYIRLLILQLNNESTPRQLHLEAEHVQLELNSSLIETASQFVPRKKETSDDTNMSKINVTAGFTEIGIYVSVSDQTCVYLMGSRVEMENTDHNMIIVARRMHLARQTISSKRLLLRDAASASGLCMDCSDIERAKITLDKSRKVVSIHCNEGVTASWSPVLHYVLLTLLRDIKRCFDLNVSRKDSDDKEEVASQKTEIRVNLANQNRLYISLNGKHKIQIDSAALKFRKLGTNALVMETKRIEINIDDHSIFLLEPIRIEKMVSHLSILESRQLAQNLQTETNCVWVTTIGKAQMVFPYNYNFAAAYEEFSSMVKWLKLIHEIKKRPFTVDSPLPSDLMILIEDFVFELSDDPFEVQLRDNYLLLMDEYLESERRWHLLDAKLNELRKTSPLLPQSKVQELYGSLLNRSSEIYIQRSKQLYGGKPSRTNLFRWTLRNTVIKAVADLSFHGEANATSHIRDMDPDSPWPKSAEFNTLWCRAVEFDFSEWVMIMRDYQQPYVRMVDGHIWGKLAAAEAEGNERAKRTTITDLGAPFGRFTISRNMPPLKFYYDLSSDIGSMKCAYGPCWEPCLAMINICFDKIIKPSADPSPSLPFWDKIRLLFHGRLSLVSELFVVDLLASSDPYNLTEQMEWSFKNLEFDWINGRVIILSDLDVYIRTASKYDDCRLLHLPKLRFHTKFNWSCLGDPNDHHAVFPCAPDKLPEYSMHKEHDSYRAFRSQHLDLSLSLQIKRDVVISDSQCPQLLLYANTFRWLDGLKNTISAVHRPIRRGPIFSLFKNTRIRKLQLSRHYKHLELSLSLPRFIISYWYSFSSDRGVRVIGQKILLSASYQLLRRRRSGDNLSRRAHTNLRVEFMNAELADAEVYLFSEKPELAGDSNKSFFMSVHKWTYCRESCSEKNADGSLSAKPTHKVVIHDFKGAWTSSNRDVVLFILDGIQKARVLRRNLSTAALKTWQVSEEKPERLTSRKSLSAGAISDANASPSNNAATDLLEQLIAEADTKFVAYSEETAEVTSQQLHGITLSQMDDELFTKWQIELVNSQVALKGCETGGYLLCTAARAVVTQKLHSPVWRGNELLGKETWVAMLNDMQYYATLGTKKPAGVSGTCSLDDVKWLSQELIGMRGRSDQCLNVVESFCNNGDAAGGVVSENDSIDPCPQLQRIISRCNCQLYFCHFTDSAEMEDCGALPPLPSDEAEAFLNKKEFVDCFTLKHNMLNISTSPRQYEMILDVVNNLLLYVDPKKKESAEKSIRYRFQLQLQSVDDLRPNILRLQDEMRQLLNEQRYLERRIYAINRMSENNMDIEQLKTHNQVAQEMEDVKLELSSKSEELAITITCFREKQVQNQRHALLRISEGNEDLQALIARRFEVCFEDAQWRLTDADGLLGLSDFQIRNFLYTKVSRINDSGEHLLEIGFAKITNLLPNSPYRDVLQMQSRADVPNDRQPAVRVICRDLAPVGGISVKEHFEINVVPMVVQINYVYFRAMMSYFFPDRNIDSEDQQNLDNGFEHSPVEAEKIKAQISNQVKQKNAVRKRRDKDVAEDYVDKMKQRAEKNNVFLYIKIPEVPFLVSYKGEKEKNIEDVENFQLQFPLVEYHDRNWTWLDLALAIKQRCKRVLLHQFMRQKLLRSRLGAAFGNSQVPTDLSNLPEEEKARLLLGTKLMGTPEKMSKKTYLSKRE